MLATMTWQVPGDAQAAAESGVASAPSLIMTAAQAYIDTQTAKMALQAVSAQTPGAKAASSKATAARDDMASFAQFERKCLKKVSKRRNAKLVHVPCSPLQGEQADVLAAADTSAGQVRKAAKRTPSGAFARQVQ